MRQRGDPKRQTSGSVAGRLASEQQVSFATDLREREGERFLPAFDMIRHGPFVKA